MSIGLQVILTLLVGLIAYWQIDDAAQNVRKLQWVTVITIIFSIILIVLTWREDTEEEKQLNEMRERIVEMHKQQESVKAEKVKSDKKLLEILDKDLGYDFSNNFSLLQQKQGTVNGMVMIPDALTSRNSKQYQFFLPILRLPFSKSALVSEAGDLNLLLAFGKRGETAKTDITTMYSLLEEVERQEDRCLSAWQSASLTDQKMIIVTLTEEYKNLRNSMERANNSSLELRTSIFPQMNPIGSN